MVMKWLYSFDDFNKDWKRLNEGLIKSISIDEVIDSLDMGKFNSEINIIKNNHYKFEIFFNSNEKLENDIYYFNITISIFGYYVSKYDIILNNNQKISDKFYKSNFEKDFILNKNNIKQLKFIVETKFNKSLYGSGIVVPDFLYHITALRNKEKILQNGLIPRSNSKKSFHQNRIYLFTDLTKVNILANQFSNYDFNFYTSKYKNNDFFINKFDIKNYYSDFYKYMLVKIDCEKIKETLVLNTDPNFIDGFFTYDNIYPDYITIINENL